MRDDSAVGATGLVFHSPPAPTGIMHALNADPIESHLLMLNLMAKQDCVQANKSDHSQSLHAPADDTPLTRTQQLV